MSFKSDLFVPFFVANCTWINYDMCLERVDQIELCFLNLISLRPVYMNQVRLGKMVF